LKPILYLEGRIIVNYFRQILRSPKRWIPILLFGIFLSFQLSIVFLMKTLGSHRPSSMFSLSMYTQREIWAVIFVLMSLIMVGFLISSFSRSMLVFSLSEIDFLFGSPVDRRIVLGSKLFRVYAKTGGYLLLYLILFVPYLTMFSRSTQILAAVAASVGVLVFSILLINICTVINLITEYRQDGKWWLASVVKGIALGLLVFGTVIFAVNYKPYNSPIENMVNTLMHPVLMAVLFPAKWAADLIASAVIGWKPVYGLELFFLSTCALISTLVVFSRKENPYEPSLVISTRMAAVRAAFRAGKTNSWRVGLKDSGKKMKNVRTGVPPFGVGAWALLWKSANIAVRTYAQTYVVYLIFVLGGLAVYNMVAGDTALGDLSLSKMSFWPLYLLLMSASNSARRLRGELSQANLLKPMPIEPWKIIAITTLSGPISIAVILLPIAVISFSLFKFAYKDELFLAVTSIPFLCYAITCAQSSVAVKYPNVQDQSEAVVSMLLMQFVGFIAVAPPIIAGVLLHAFGAGTFITEVVVVIVSLGVASIGITVGAAAYRSYDPTSD